ncbi:hypothetical protein ACIPN8_36280 [Streptomyces sp. NPDC086082]|uniref:hypothetical protein n=1 Tax=Streptomyces sp. NPDC086082 TaxID=3365750 RepID=UPI0037F872FD
MTPNTAAVAVDGLPDGEGQALRPASWAPPSREGRLDPAHRPTGSVPDGTAAGEET